EASPTRGEGRPYFRPPGYAHFLAAVYATTGHNLHAARVAQALLGGLSVLLLGLLAASLWDARVGMVAALLGALYGPAIYFDGELVSASLEVFLALLALWLLVEGEKRRSGAWCAAAGLAIALGAVTRPTILPFAAIAAVWLLWRRVPASAAALFAVAALSLPAACTLRNAAVAGDPVFIASQGGINFYIGNHARADGTTPYVPGLGSGVTATYDAPMREASRLAGRPLKESEVSAFWLSKGLEFWRDDPRAAAALFAKKLAMMWNRRELPNTQDQAFFGPFNSWLFRGPWLPGFALLAPIALAAAWFERKRAAILLLYAAALTAVTAAFFVCDRFRLPLLAFVAPLAAAGVVRAWDAWKAARANRSEPAVGPRGAARAAVPAAAFLVVAAALVWLPFPRWQKVEEGMSWFRLATAYEQARDERQAARSYLFAEKAGLAAPEFYNNYGLVALREGDLAAAGERFRRAVALDPSYGPALANLAEVYMRQESWNLAAAAYGAAAGAVPERAAEFLTNAGVIYQRMGRTEAARVAFVRALAARPDFELAAEALRMLGPDPDEVSHREAAAAKAAAEKAAGAGRGK
ncbi:MAG TPA: glycosyltransferase family 39 protein, partial [Candidatus Eisenbacteria bacterium]|nr:glycosyltransferase family 39 protein [Candidatus Eisenbacteria bacterium]